MMLSQKVGSTGLPVQLTMLGPRFRCHILISYTDRPGRGVRRGSVGRDCAQDHELPMINSLDV